MFYTPKGFVFENKSQKPLKEGGGAAETLITTVLDPDGSRGLKSPIQIFECDCRIFTLF